jgi:TRAP transporter TAXI family solute receptor
MYRFISTGLAAVLAVVLHSAPAAGQENRQLQILTLPAGSMAYRVGVTLAASLTRGTPYKAIVAGYGGAQVIVPMLDSGRADLALLNANDAGQGYRGESPFRGAHAKLRLISNAYANTVGIIVARDSDITSIAGIRGRRVTGVFSSHKSCEQLAAAQMANLDLSREDVRLVPVSSPVAAIEALAEGRADVALCVTPDMPAALEADNRLGIRYLSLDPSPEAVRRLQRVFNAGTVSRAPGGSLPGLTEDTFFLEYDYYLVAGVHLEEAAVTAVLDLLWDGHAGLVRENREFETWTPARMPTRTNTIPYHPAALEYFKTKGINLPR